MPTASEGRQTLDRWTTREVPRVPLVCSALFKEWGYDSEEDSILDFPDLKNLVMMAMGLLRAFIN